MSEQDELFELVKGIVADFGAEVISQPQENYPKLTDDATKEILAKAKQHYEQNEFTSEEKYLFESIISARKVQEFLWGFVNSEWGLEEWRRMFRKRLQKIDDIDASKPHWKVEMKKRLLQNTALSIALLALLDNKDIPEGVHPSVPSNLEDYENV